MEKDRVLVIDDDLNTLKMVDQLLSIKKYAVTTCLTFRDAMRELNGGEGYSAAIIDYFMPDVTGLEMLRAIRQADPELPVLILTASRDIKIAVEIIREGAFNYLVKPVEPDELYLNVGNAIKSRRLVMENKSLKMDLKERYKFEQIVGESGAMMEVFDLTARAAKVRSTALIIGETGSGKELVARAIHYNSDRADGPFIRVNCSALAESMLEAELFGIEKNVATGVDARIGKFEAAHGGTLFLDEIGDMAPATQAKVLRAMQEREIERVGSNTPRKVDIRIIAATNRDLAAMSEKKEFRQDLFYRLNVLVIPIPPLRERMGDVPGLVEHFLEKVCAENRMRPKTISRETMDILMSHSWPGNVRELENTVERAVVLCDGDTVGAECLPAYIAAGRAAAALPVSEPGPESEQGGALDEMVNDYERKLIVAALEKSGWRQNRAAEALGITERSMWYKIKKLGIETRRETTGGAL